MTFLPDESIRYPSHKLRELKKRISSISILLDPSLLNETRKLIYFFEMNEELGKLSNLLDRLKIENVPQIYEKVRFLYQFDERLFSPARDSYLKIERICSKSLNYLEVKGLDKLKNEVENFCRIAEGIIQLRKLPYFKRLKEIEKEIGKRENEVEEVSIKLLVEASSRLKDYEYFNYLFREGIKGIVEKRENLIFDHSIQNDLKLLSSFLYEIKFFAEEKNDEELYKKTEEINSLFSFILTGINEKNIREASRVIMRFPAYMRFLKKVIQEYLAGERKLAPPPKIEVEAPPKIKEEVSVVEEELVPIEEHRLNLRILIELFEVVDRHYGTTGIMRDVCEKATRELERMGYEGAAKLAAKICELLENFEEETSLASVDRIRKKYIERLKSSLREKFMKLIGYK